MAGAVVADGALAELFLCLLGGGLERQSLRGQVFQCLGGLLWVELGVRHSVGLPFLGLPRGAWLPRGEAQRDVARCGWGAQVFEAVVVA